MSTTISPSPQGHTPLLARQVNLFLFQTDMVNWLPHFPQSHPPLGHALPPEGPCVVQKGCDTQELLDALH